MKLLLDEDLSDRGKLIDSDDKRYSVSLLQRWKSLSEQAALLDLEIDSTFNGLRQSNSASQDFKNGSGTQVNIGNTTIGHKTVYNQHASEVVYEVKIENGVKIRTTPVFAIAAAVATLHWLRDRQPEP